MWPARRNNLPEHVEARFAVVVAVCCVSENATRAAATTSETPNLRCRTIEQQSTASALTAYVLCWANHSSNSSSNICGMHKQTEFRWSCDRTRHTLFFHASVPHGIAKHNPKFRRNRQQQKHTAANVPLLLLLLLLLLCCCAAVALFSCVSLLCVSKYARRRVGTCIQGYICRTSDVLRSRKV